MYGDDSRLRLRRISSVEGGSVLPMYGRSNGHHHGGTPLSGNGGPLSSSSSRRRRKSGKMRRRRKMYAWAKTCLSGLAATLVSAGLSLSLLPLSWYQVDYHHQVQRAASHLLQRVELNRHNYATSMRGNHDAPLLLTAAASHSGKHNYPPPQQVRCPDGTIGFENDNYCDCVDDGSDEPLTSACSHLHVQQALFPCRSDRSIRIYPSRVLDGVRDCPDGSDEDPVL